MKTRLISLFLAAIMTFGALAIVPGAAQDYTKIYDEITCEDSWQSSSSTRMFSAATGEAQSFNYDVPEGGATLIVFFNAKGDAFSAQYFDSISEVMSDIDAPFNVVALEMTGRSRAEVNSFMAEHDKNKVVDEVFYNTSGTYLPTYYMRQVGANNVSSVFLALVFLVTRENGKNYIRFYADGQCSAAGSLKALSDFIDLGEAAPKMYEVTPIGTLNFEFAHEVARLANEKRKELGLSTLTVSGELMKLAMVRAIECSINYDHTRPNGDQCFSVTFNGKGYSGFIRAENIAVGQPTPAAVMTEWIKSKKHYNNLTIPDVEQIGVGSFENDGVIYWVQLFGRGNDGPLLGEDGKAYTEIIENVAHKVETNEIFINVVRGLEYEEALPEKLGEGESAEVRLPYWYNKNPEWKTTLCIPSGIDARPNGGTISCSIDSACEEVMGFRVIPERKVTVTGSNVGTLGFAAYTGPESAGDRQFPGVIAHELIKEVGADGADIWRCEKCGRKFADENATVEIIDKVPDEEIPDTSEASAAVKDPEEPAPYSGDTNGDGALNAKDVTSLMKYLVGMLFGRFYDAAADFNGDGKVNAKDVVAIMKRIISGK